MTTSLTEGDLQITFPPGAKPRKFDDDAKHGLAHCMKAVDFIVEFSDRYWFIEFKDPQHPAAKKKDRELWLQQFKDGIIDEDFKYKYRDSFLYQWASTDSDKPIHYFVLVAEDSLSEAELLHRTDELRRKLPVEGPPSAAWKRRFVAGCAVFNIGTWNRSFSDYRVSRVSS